MENGFYDSNGLLCVCKKEKNKDIIELAAIDTIENVSKETNSTTVASKGGVEGLYWYFVKGKSFGFSNEPKIKLLEYTDIEKGDLRLTWHLCVQGGWSIHWEKIILIL